MKTGAKVFLVFAFIGQILMTVGGCVNMMVAYDEAMTVSGIFIMIGSVIAFFVGIYAWLKLNEAKTAQELKATAIVTLIFCSLIAGIIMLCIKDEDLKSATSYYTAKDDSRNENRHERSYDEPFADRTATAATPAAKSENTVRFAPNNSVYGAKPKNSDKTLARKVLAGIMEELKKRDGGINETEVVCADFDENRKAFYGKADVGKLFEGFYLALYRKGTYSFYVLSIPPRAIGLGKVELSGDRNDFYIEIDEKLIGKYSGTDYSDFKIYFQYLEIAGGTSGERARCALNFFIDGGRISCDAENVETVDFNRGKGIYESDDIDVEKIFDGFSVALYNKDSGAFIFLDIPPRALSLKDVRLSDEKDEFTLILDKNLKTPTGVDLSGYGIFSDNVFI